MNGEHPDLRYCTDERVASIISSTYVHIDENVFLKGANGLVPTQEYMGCECKYDKSTVELSFKSSFTNGGRCRQLLSSLRKILELHK